MPPQDRKASTLDVRTDLANAGPDEARALLAAALAPDLASGVLRVSGEAAVIVRPEVIVNIQKQLEQTIGGSAKGIMYLSGERSSGAGLNPLGSLRSGSKGTFSIESAQRIIDASALLGWGRAEVALFDPDRGRFLFTIKNSPIAIAYGSSKKPVCHFLAGWIAGMGRILLAKELLCEEIACVAQGRDFCEFDLRPMPSH